jgi:hypothetical protein
LRKHLQAENGFLDTDRQGQDIVDGPETLLRFGVAAKTELRLTAPDYYYGLNGSGSGFGDLAVGVKQQLGPTPGGFEAAGRNHNAGVGDRRPIRYDRYRGVIACSLILAV